MRIETADFGPQDIDPESIIDFPNGIPGFEGNRQFKLFNEENARQVYFLQSVSNPQVAFSIIDPAELNVFYEITLDDRELDLLETDDPDEIAIMVFAYRDTRGPQETDESTATSGMNFSFMNPLAINFIGKRGIMKMLSNTSQQITIRTE